MNRIALARFRLMVAVVCGFACLAAAATSFHMQTSLAQVAIAAFGLCWFAQAYAIRNQMPSRRA